MAKDIQTRNERTPTRSSNQLSDFDRLVDRFFGDRMGALFGDLPTPSRRYFMDINETDDSYLLCAEIPGIPKEDIDINVNGNLLTIKAEHSEEEKQGEDRAEKSFRRRYQSFHQSFSLPSTVDVDKIEARCEDGLLEIVLPKSEAAQPKRIEVQTGRGQSSKQMKVGSERQSETQAKH